MIVIAAAFAVLIYFSYLDFKTREVDDKFTYGFLGAAIVFQVGRFLLGEPAALTALIVGGVLFAMGYLMYLTQQWGGADVFVLAALGVLFGNNIGFMLGYFIDIFIVAFFYSIAWAIYEAAKSEKVQKDFVKRVKGDRHELYMLVALLVICVVAAVFTSAKFVGMATALRITTPLYWLVLAIPLFWVLLKFVKAVEIGCFRIKRKASELIEYDLLIEDLWMEKGKVERVPAEEAAKTRKEKDVLISSSDPNGLTLEQIETIQKLVKAGKLDDGFVVKWGLPLIPVFPIALGVALVWGNLIGLFV